jgi:hypothetical protein
MNRPCDIILIIYSLQTIDQLLLVGQFFLQLGNYLQQLFLVLFQFIQFLSQRYNLRFTFLERRFQSFFGLHEGTFHFIVGFLENSVLLHH